jgi:hypothetical protein
MTSGLNWQPLADTIQIHRAGIDPPFFFVMKNFNAEFRISRSPSSKGEDGISILIRDQNARITLCEFNLTLEQFAQVITGLSIEDIKAKSYVLDERLGTKQQVNLREILCPVKWEKREFYEKWFEENVKVEDGEITSFYLGSQSSVSQREDGAILRYTVKSWPDAK